MRARARARTPGTSSALNSVERLRVGGTTNQQQRQQTQQRRHDHYRCSARRACITGTGSHVRAVATGRRHGRRERLRHQRQWWQRPARVSPRPAPATWPPGHAAAIHPFETRTASALPHSSSAAPMPHTSVTQLLPLIYFVDVTCPVLRLASSARIDLCEFVAARRALRRVKRIRSRPSEFHTQSTQAHHAESRARALRRRQPALHAQPVAASVLPLAHLPHRHNHHSPTATTATAAWTIITPGSGCQ